MSVSLQFTLAIRRDVVSMAFVQPFIVVAIAGFVRPIQVRTRKLLTHCGVTVIEIPCSASALETLRRKVSVNAVVIDARSLAPSEQPVPEFAAMASSSGEASDGLAPMPVVVLGDRHVPAWVRPMCERAGARFVSIGETGPNYPKLIRLLRHTCGIQTACCRPAALEGDR